jgi:lipopolysaccharide transport system permease protein
LIIGFVFWEWFQSCVNFSMPSIGSKASLLQLIYLPKFIFPMCSILSNTWKFVCVLSVLIVYLWIEGFPPNISYVALPLVLLIQFALIVSVSFPAAIVYPIFPDSQIFIQTLFRGLMLVS